ncbi:MAG: hypothetical protein NWF05_00900 [Candidatus Bathyarchaeota archaeon]|nr:hypothetical protein [Candidatus Bathyarchaeota archaeon]
MDLKRLLASSIRQRILEALSESRGILRMMQLVHKVGSPYNEVNRNLAILEAEGIIINDCSKPVKHSVVRTIRLNRENPKTTTLLQALKLLGKEKEGKP